MTALRRLAVLRARNENAPLLCRHSHHSRDRESRARARSAKPSRRARSDDEVARRDRCEAQPGERELDDAATKAEKRTPISALPFTIATPGSYYLTGNLTGTAGQDAITINADNVAIDLNGFTLSGPGGAGITSAAGQRISVRSGTIEGFTSGIRAANSVVFVEDVQLANNPLDGINVGAGSIVQSCSVRNSGTSNSGRGILAGAASVISKCTVIGTSGQAARAIDGGNGSVIVDCTARENDAPGGLAIRGGASSSIVRCHASLNSGTNAAIEPAPKRRSLSAYRRITTAPTIMASHEQQHADQRVHAYLERRRWHRRKHTVHSPEQSCSQQCRPRDRGYRPLQPPGGQPHEQQRPGWIPDRRDRQFGHQEQRR